MPFQEAQDATHIYIEKANRFLKRIENVGTKAPANLMVAMMKLLEWWLEVCILGIG